MNFYKEIVKISKEAHDKKLEQGTKKFIELLKEEIRAAAEEGHFYIEYYDTTGLKYWNYEVSMFFQLLGFEVDVKKQGNGCYVWIICWGKKEE